MPISKLRQCATQPNDVTLCFFYTNNADAKRIGIILYPIFSDSYISPRVLRGILYTTA